MHVVADLNYVLDVRDRRITFSANETIFALRFPTSDLCRIFGESLNDAVFNNQYGVENDEVSRQKVLEDFAGTLFSKDTERAFEPMDTGAEEEETYHTPEKMSEKQAKQTALDEDIINGIIMGAGTG